MSRESYTIRLSRGEVVLLKSMMEHHVNESLRIMQESADVGDVRRVVAHELVLTLVQGLRVKLEAIKS